MTGHGIWGHIPSICGHMTVYVRVTGFQMMDFDDHRDYMDQDDPAGQFPTVDPGPIHQFLSGIPDWLNLNPEDLDRALESLPIHLKGQTTPKMSLQDAIDGTIYT